MASSEFAAEVVNLLRPRDSGVIRSRAPLAWQLFRAAREDRLIWMGPDSFAVLRAPAERRSGTDGRLLRWADRYWNAWILFGGLLALLGVALLLVALRPVIGREATIYGGFTVLLLVLGLIIIDQLTFQVRAVWRGLRSALGAPLRLETVASQTLPFEQWTLMLCHHVAATGAGALLDAVDRRLAALAGSDEPLACPRNAVTTAHMRTQVAAWSEPLPGAEDGSQIGVRLPRRRPVRTHPARETGAFFFICLGGVFLMLALFAVAIPAWELPACGASCAGRPVTYPAALEWIFYQALWRESPDLSAISWYSRSTGLMARVFLPLIVLVGVAALVYHVQYRRELLREVKAGTERLYRMNRVLLVVATEVERQAVLRRAAKGRDSEPRPDFTGGHPVYRLGVIGGADVVLAQTGMGVTSPVSAAYGVPELLREWSPRYVVMVGICFGLREDYQSLGDVIVGRQLRVINHRIGEGEKRDRGDQVTAGHRLVERFTVADPPPGARVWHGQLLSWDVLVDSPTLRNDLRARYPDALGGEMEGAGVYAAAVRDRTEWIVVKGICDWGREKTYDFQELAAGNAAEFVLGLIEARAFAHG